MKEITRIHLAAIPFNVEIAAKKELETYLVAVEKSLQADEDTLREIEVRIIELLAERNVIGERVITTSDIAAIERQLGAPGEFVDEQDVEREVSSVASGKRLMRDVDHGMLGGVLAGVAVYFNVNPIWLRLAAIILGFVSFGTVALVYVVLWIVIPAARTAAEKLQLAGKPVTLEAIKKQSSIAAEVPERGKVMVTIIRIMLCLGFALAAVGGVVMLGVGIAAGIPVLYENSDMLNTWLIYAGALAGVSGVLFVLLMSIAAYATFTWRVSRRVGISCIAIIIAGILSASVAFGTGVYGASIYSDEVSDMTRTEKIDLSTTLHDAKKMVVQGQSVSIDYYVTNEAPRAEIRTVSNEPTTYTLDMIRDGEVVTFRTDNLKQEACSGWRPLCLNELSVKIYGPELSTLEANGSVTYTPAVQDRFEVVTRGSAAISIVGGSIGTLQGSLSDNSYVTANEAAIGVSEMTLTGGARVYLGNIGNAVFTLPQSCASGNKASIHIERLSELRIGDVITEQNEYISQNCAEIIIAEPINATL